MSISDLELGTVLALTRKAEPDSETMLDSHIRIGANMAAAQQKPLIVKYRASLSSDKTIAHISTGKDFACCSHANFSHANDRFSHAVYM